MMRRFGLALALCSLAATTAVAGTVYKWADRQGQVHYTDRPPRGDRPQGYDAGSSGPEDALMLMHRDGRRWREIKE